jgi:hypothetical protein
MSRTGAATRLGGPPTVPFIGQSVSGVGMGSCRTATSGWTDAERGTTASVSVFIANLLALRACLLVGLVERPRLVLDRVLRLVGSQPHHQTLALLTRLYLVTFTDTAQVDGMCGSV